MNSFGPSKEQHQQSPSSAFGEGQPHQDPDGDGQLTTLNLRFPGQYYDTESGLHYNYFRSYNPSTGRYTQSDPIGLAGGVNTFAYANNLPSKMTDPYGLVSWSGRIESMGYGLIAGKINAQFVLTSEIKSGEQWRVVVHASAKGSYIGKGAWSVSASRITFDDGLDQIDPLVFTGDFTLVNAGFSTPHRRRIF